MQSSLTGAQALFADFLREHDHGQEQEFREFCRVHGEHESELQKLWTNWKQVAGVLRSLPPASRQEWLGGGAAAGSVGDFLDQLRSSATSPGRYELEGIVARGGMGVIRAVRDHHLERRLAMKTVRPAARVRPGQEGPSGDTISRRLVEEARQTARLDHPGIVPIHDLGVDSQGKLYFTMKLVSGQHLGEVMDDAIRTRTDADRNRVLECLSRVCDAVAFAHSRGVVHRDLKPANVMVGEFGEVYVMDWGLAKSLPSAADSGSAMHRGQPSLGEPDDPSRTRVGEVVGTPAYMPPEQAHGRLEEIAPATDVYALGAMLYHLLAGHPPYGDAGHSSTDELLELLKSRSPSPIHGAAPLAPPELAAICERAMQRRSARRYRNMREVAADLRAYLTGHVVRAHRTGAIAELRTWTRRNRGFAAALAGLVLVTVAGVGGGFLQQHLAKERLEREAREAALPSTFLVDVVDSVVEDIENGHPSDAYAMAGLATGKLLTDEEMSPFTRGLLGTVFARLFMAEEHWEEAEDLLADAAETYSDSGEDAAYWCSEVFKEIGTVYLATDRIVEARHAFETAVEASLRDSLGEPRATPDLRVLHGIALSRLGRRGLALEQLCLAEQEYSSALGAHSEEAVEACLGIENWKP